MDGVSRQSGRFFAVALGAALATWLAGAPAAAQETLRTGSYPGLSVNAVLGAEGALTQTLGLAGSQMDSGGGVGFYLNANALRAPWDEERTFRFMLRGLLGFGTSGFEGAIASEGAYGLRWAESFADPHRSDIFATSSIDDTNEHAFRDGGWHAIFGRIGYSMHLTHNDRVESSLVEVPRIEVGYQLLGGFAIEARAQAGLVLTGNLSHGDADRPLGMGVGWGGKLAMYGRSGMVEAGIERIELFDDALGPVNVADGRACVLWSRMRGATAGLCASGRVEDAIYHRTDGIDTEGTSIYGGLLVGVGLH